MTVRKNAFKLTEDEQKRYINVIQKMIDDGSYGKIVDIHKDMSHRMHHMRGDLVSMLRFLPWHRAYLLHMEAEMQKRDGKVFIPYWSWPDGGVPPWLVGFTPKVNGVENKRSKLTAPISSEGRISVVKSEATFNTFTDELERDPHNKGHMDLGTPMNSVITAPCDPIFWMHHGQVDRVWAQWQATHPGLDPVLTGKDAVMDPWSEDVNKLRSITALGYSYG